jgi:hypothetical protein
MNGTSEVSSMMHKRVCPAARAAHRLCQTLTRNGRVATATYGFFLGPSCKAPWRFCPALALAEEFSSSDMYDFRLVTVEGWRWENHFFGRAQYLYLNSQAKSTIRRQRSRNMFHVALTGCSDSAELPAHNWRVTEKSVANRIRRF